MSDWQDMAAAPKANLASLGNDSLIGPMIVLSDGQRETKGYWRETFDMDDGDGGTDWLSEGWVDGLHDELLDWTPTRWRPV